MCIEYLRNEAKKFKWKPQTQKNDRSSQRSSSRTVDYTKCQEQYKSLGEYNGIQYNTLLLTLVFLS